MKKMMIFTAALFAFGAAAQEIENPDIAIFYSNGQKALSNDRSQEEAQELRETLYSKRNGLCVNEALLAANDVATSPEIEDFISKGYQTKIEVSFYDNSSQSMSLRLEFSHESLPYRKFGKMTWNLRDTCSHVRESLSDFTEGFLEVASDYEEFDQFNGIFDSLNNIQIPLRSDSSHIADTDRGVYGEDSQLGASFDPGLGSTVFGY